MRYLVFLLLLLGPVRAEDPLPGTYEVHYWELGKGTAQPPKRDETLTVKAQGQAYAVTWHMPDKTELHGLGLRNGNTFSVAYVTDREPGLIVYQVVVDKNTVKLAKGRWTTGLKATQVGAEEAVRLRAGSRSR